MEKELYVISWLTRQNKDDSIAARGTLLSLHSTADNALAFYQATQTTLTQHYDDPVSINGQGVVALRLTRLAASHFGGGSALLHTLHGETLTAEKENGQPHLIHKFTASGDLSLPFMMPAFSSAIMSGDMIFKDTGRIVPVPPTEPAPGPTRKTRVRRRPPPGNNPAG